MMKPTSRLRSRTRDVRFSFPHFSSFMLDNIFPIITYITIMQQASSCRNKSIGVSRQQ